MSIVAHLHGGQQWTLWSCPVKPYGLNPETTIGEPHVARSAGLLCLWLGRLSSLRSLGGGVTMKETPKHHFFLSSVGTWCTTGQGRTLSEAIKLMEREKLTFWVWYVPVEPEADYEISMFAPQVPGAHIVETVEFKNGRRVKQ